MIRVEEAPEPPEFHSLVRAPGLCAIAEMVGELSTIKHSGRRCKKIADLREDIPSNKFPQIWRKSLDHLLVAYNRVCAYWCFRIHPATGSATLDHFAAKSLHWDRVYEWNNYRLACGAANALKREFSDVLDPFDVQTGFFELDLISMKVVPGALAGERLTEVRDTISRLRLDSGEYRSAVESYYNDYMQGNVTFYLLKKHAPFLALEIERQGKRRSGD